MGTLRGDSATTRDGNAKELFKIAKPRMNMFLFRLSRTFYNQDLRPIYRKFGNRFSFLSGRELDWYLV